MKVPTQLPEGLVPLTKDGREVVLRSIEQLEPGKWYLAGDRRIAIWVESVTKDEAVVRSSMALTGEPVKLQNTLSYTYIPLVVDPLATSALSDDAADKEPQVSEPTEKASPKKAVMSKKSTKTAASTKAASTPEAPKASENSKSKEKKTVKGTKKTTKKSAKKATGTRVSFEQGKLGQLLASGVPVKEIAEKLGTSYSSVMSQINGAIKRGHKVKKVKPGVYKI